MKVGKSHIFAFTLGLVPFVVTMFLLNNDPIGPEVLNKEAYMGCYGDGSGSVLRIGSHLVSGIGTNESTRLKRILSVKSDDAINTERELIFEPHHHSLRIGERDTGFFYVFDRREATKTLILYDGQGSPHHLAKRAC